ncbi:uracil-DNA glycosylase [Desulfitobacterium sp. Sab5]|uniref:uracil-DNA glycosylase n=1 Tax=Desulfitobacterium nosdiversum TaxID=3375356 RepID=UPI003CF97028
MTDEKVWLDDVNDLGTLKNVCMKTFFPAADEKLVFGEGPGNASFMIIGEAPGEEEAKSGRPFVGNSGRLLNKYLEEAEIARDHVYITNILKTRPPGNRKPKNSEMSQALPFLERQIQLVRPKIIVCLGSTAVQAIVDPKAKITELRGTWVERGNFKIMPTFHPSAVFRDEGKRQLLKRDLIEAGNMLKRIIPQSV